MARRCLGRLYVVWTGQMTPHWWAGVALQTSPRGGQWLWLQKEEAVLKDRGSLFRPHRGQEGPLPLEVPLRPALQRVGRVLGGLCRHWPADVTGRASRRRRAHSLHGGRHVLRAAGLALQIQKWKQRRERKRVSWRVWKKIIGIYKE